MVSLLIEWHANSQSPAAFRSQRYGQNHASPEPLPDKIPIDAKPLAASRGFVLRRLSDAGLCTGPSITSGRHPKPFTKAAVAVTAAGFGNFELIVVVFLFQAVQSVVEHSKARPIKATLAMFRQNSAIGRSRRRKPPRTPSRPGSSARHCSPGVVRCRAV